jgi:hypothetical protein
MQILCRMLIKGVLAGRVRRVTIDAAHLTLQKNKRLCLIQMIRVLFTSR